jgi:hypothetical protein
MDGGAIGYSREEQKFLDLEDCIFSSNLTIQLLNVGLRCTNCRFFRNGAGRSGGAIWKQMRYNFTLHNSIFIENFVKGCENGGGAIRVISSGTTNKKFNFTNSIFIKNEVLGSCVSVLISVYY